LWYLLAKVSWENKREFVKCAYKEKLHQRPDLESIKVNGKSTTEIVVSEASLLWGFCCCYFMLKHFSESHQKRTARVFFLQFLISVSHLFHYALNPFFHAAQ